jgi:hypothetical protein
MDSTDLAYQRLTPLDQNTITYRSLSYDSLYNAHNLIQESGDPMPMPYFLDQADSPLLNASQVISSVSPAIQQAEGLQGDDSAGRGQRSNIGRSCDECRRRKVKCDGLYPCSRCIQSFRAQSRGKVTKSFACRYSGIDQRRKRRKNEATCAELSERLVTLDLNPRSDFSQTAVLGSSHGRWSKRMRHFTLYWPILLTWNLEYMSAHPFKPIALQRAQIACTAEGRPYRVIHKSSFLSQTRT